MKAVIRTVGKQIYSNTRTDGSVVRSRLVGLDRGDGVHIDEYFVDDRFAKPEDLKPGLNVQYFVNQNDKISLFEILA